jgi:hypothetical protein
MLSKGFSEEAKEVFRKVVFDNEQIKIQELP